MGSVTQQCNVNTGCCFCRDQFTGEKCNECKLGYRNFPHCVSCDCSLSGSNTETCEADAGVCACAERTGQCSCKVSRCLDFILDSFPRIRCNRRDFLWTEASVWFSFNSSSCVGVFYCKTCVCVCVLQLKCTVVNWDRTSRASDTLNTERFNCSERVRYHTQHHSHINHSSLSS